MSAHCTWIERKRILGAAAQFRRHLEIESFGAVMIAGNELEKGQIYVVTNDSLGSLISHWYQVGKIRTNNSIADPARRKQDYYSYD